MYYKNAVFKDQPSSIFEPSLCVLKSLQLFQAKDFLKMLETDNDGFLTFLSEHQYDINIQPAEEIFKKSEKKLLKEMTTLSHDPLLKEYFLLPYDFFNLKLIFKGLLKSEPFESLKLGITGTLSLSQLKKVYDGMVCSLKLPLIRSISLFNREIDGQSPFEVSALWDKYLFSYYLEQSRKINIDFLIRLHQLETDLTNLLSLFRLKLFDKGLKTFKKFFISGGNLSVNTLVDLFKEEVDIIYEKLSYLDFSPALKKGVDALKKTGLLTDMEKNFKHFYFSFLKKASLCFFGREGMIAYYWLKKNEISNLRLIHTAKQNNINKNMIINSLRIWTKRMVYAFRHTGGR